MGAASTKALPAVLPENVVPMAPAGEGTALAASEAKLKKPPRCAISATVKGPRELDGVKLEQEPDALLTVLGDRSDTGAKVGETKDASPYALSMLNDVMSIALAGDTLTRGPLNAERVNAMLQQMSAFEPADELEGMIALQAVAMHRATMDSARRGLAATRADHRAQYLGQANKCSRTFAALLEQLNRHRGKTTTQKFVFETHVGDGGQAVVGAAVGVGRYANGENQPHEQNQARHGGGARGAPLFGSWAQRDAVPATSEQEQETLPPARRSAGERSAEGQSQQPEARALHGGGDHDAPTSQPDAERSSQSAGLKQ